MNIRYLGTGAAEGVPAVFCDCEICKNIRKAGRSEFRTRSQVVIDDVLSVDFPPDAYVHSLSSELNFASLRYILVTHSHMDHFYAHDFILRGYKYGCGFDFPLEIYLNEEAAAVYAECTRREMKPVVAPNIKIHAIKPYSHVEFGGYRVLTLPANHTKTEDALLFYIEKGGRGYLHLYDTGVPDDRIFSFLSDNNAKADAVSLDCTYADRTGIERPRHMNIEDGMLLKQKLMRCGVCNETTRFVITHFSHNSNPLSSRLAEIEKKHGVTAAFDGMEIEV